MARDHSVSRRTAVKLAGVAASTALVAGCNGGDGNGNGDGGDNGDGESYEIDPGEEILFEGNTQDWTGKSPSDIEGESNPTLSLQEEETYTIGWDEGDGGRHNIELRNDSDEVVDDYETEPTTDEAPDDQTIEFDATSEISQYVCQPHETQMVGDIEVN